MFLDVPCQGTDAPWQVTVVAAGLAAQTETNVWAQINDGDSKAGNEAELGKDTIFVDIDPTTNTDADGVVTVTGTYSCTRTFAGTATVDIAGKTQDGSLLLGTSTFAVSCPSSGDERWIATVTPAVQAARPAGVTSRAAAANTASTFFAVVAVRDQSSTINKSVVIASTVDNNNAVIQNSTLP